MCIDVDLLLFQCNLLTDKHVSAKVKDVAASVNRKLKTFMEITLEEDNRER